jgi:hypothetical protein
VRLGYRNGVLEVPREDTDDEVGATSGFRVL